MEEKAPHAEEVEGPDFPGEPAAREAPAMKIREEAAALGERMVGVAGGFKIKPPPRPSIIVHDPPGAEIPAPQKNFLCSLAQDQTISILRRQEPYGVEIFKA